MTDDELKAVTDAHETYMHDRINGAYRAGVRRCIELLQREAKAWDKNNEGACQGDISMFPIQFLEEEMQAELSTLYV
jgi:hypothetical protein